MEKLPDEYIPKSLRPAKPKIAEVVVYAIEYESGSSQYGMYHGPHPDLREMLEVVPDDPARRAFIFRFEKDGRQKRIYRWQKDRWKRLRKRSIEG